MNEDIAHQMEHKQRQSRARLRELLIAEGQHEALAEFDQNMKDVDNGVYFARMAWHSISPAQQKLITYLATHPVRLIKHSSGRFFGGQDASVDHGKLAGIKTVRALIARELLHCDGGAFDPEAVVVLTEKGRFVFEKGTQA